MKTWTAISLLNRAGLPVKQKAVYLKRAIRRLDLRVSRDHLLAANLAPIDTASLSKKHGIELKICDMFRYTNRPWTVDEFVAVGRIIPPTFKDVDTAIQYVSNKVEVMQKLAMKVSVEDIMTPGRLGYEIVTYANFLRERPTLDEIVTFTRVSYGPSCFANACIKFGYPISFATMISMSNPFMEARNVFKVMTRFGVEIPTPYMVENFYPVDVLVHQMWTHCCPIVYTLDLPPRYGRHARAKLFAGKRSIRVIQRFARACRMARAAKAIQRAWRKCITDPSYGVARARLIREFSEMKQ